METKFSYKVKESIIADMQNKVEALRELLGKLKENESRAEVPDHDDLGGLNVYLSAMEKELDSLYEAVLPMAFFEKKSASVQSSPTKGYSKTMEYRNIRVGQKLLLHGTYEAEVVQVDPRRITPRDRLPVVGDPVQVKVVLYPGEEPSLLWVNPDRLMDSND